MAEGKVSDLERVSGLFDVDKDSSIDPVDEDSFETHKITSIGHPTLRFSCARETIQAEGKKTA